MRLTPYYSRYGLWLLLGVPLALITYWYLNGKISYGDYIQHTGRFSVWLLLLTLAVTPLRQLFPGQGWSRRLVQYRRYFGVASFAYALPHVLAYVIRKETFALVAEEAAYPELWTGWLAMAIFLPLALSSNNWAVRRLGGAWKHLHRLVHLAALLTFAHWVLSAFDPLTAYLHLAVLGLLEAVRLWKSYGPRGRALL